jgi:hypothetical protein
MATASGTGYIPTVAPAPGQSARTAAERQDVARQARLDDIAAQRACGDLVIRRMTRDERAAWAARRAARDAISTDTDVLRRGTALAARRRRSGTTGD